MRLRVEGDLEKFRVVDADTGDELQGVKEVELRLSRSGYLRKCTIHLDRAAIDVSVPAEVVEAIAFEDGSYARTKLLEVVGLRWRKPK